MRVEKEVIEEAKRKLGDENAILMADLLELEDFDEKNYKSCCPYHFEDTPSFIYNKKDQRFHCFGCGKTVDLVDVYIEKGHTFLEAIQFLFEKADVQYSFGEQNVKTKRDYRYPHEEPLNARESVIEYWGKRGISKEVLDYLDVREDKNENGVFNFYDENDVLTLVKYRPARTVSKNSDTPKTWCQKGADTAHILFNMNRANTANPLLICEGETDCMSAIEAGYLNTVSIPLGAGNLHWIEECWDWLNQFSEIIIWADNDKAGEDMRKECIFRLGSWRTKYIITPTHYEKESGKLIPLKDINDCLQIGGKDFVLKLISEAKDVPVKSVVDYADIDDLDVSQMDGVKIGIKKVDKQLMRLFYGTLTILSGRPGSGKTSLIDQAIAQALDADKPVFLFSKEMPERMSANWFNSILAGRRNLEKRTNCDGDSYYIVPLKIKRKMQDYYRGKLMIYKDDEPNDVESVMKSAEECVRKYGAKLVVLDNLMMLDLQCNETNRNTAQTNLINDLIKFAAKFNIAVVLIAHPKKMQDSNADVGIYDISGSSNIINLAMRSIGLRRTSKKEQGDPSSKWGKYDVVLEIMKDRIFGKTGEKIGLWYDNVSRRFYTDYDEYDYQYNWDDMNYRNKLPYIDRSLQDVFPDK